MFGLYLELGFDHILDPQGLDHILYVIALAALFHYTEWKRILILITAFTVGHSITLALSTMEWISLSSTWTELLIVITIILTAVYNLFDRRKEGSRQLRYFSALFFGLIHGMGFSFLIRQTLMSVEDSILLPLLSFNLGLELGQILVVLGLFLLQAVLYMALQSAVDGFNRKIFMTWWSRIISIGVILYMLPTFFERIQALFQG